MKLLFLTATIIMSWGCSKQEEALRELDISITQKSVNISADSYRAPTFYPNPFYNFVLLQLNGSSEFTVNISNVEGVKKVDLNGSGASFNFSNESDGVYNAEVLINGKIYRYTLIKGNQ